MTYLEYKYNHKMSTIIKDILGYDNTISMDK